MKLCQRIVGMVAVLALAWTALWPLVTSLHDLWMAEPVMLCHQAGAQVEPGMKRSQPDAPGEPARHCPLCIMAFYGGFNAPPKPLLPDHFAVSPVHTTRIAVFHAEFVQYLPPSRAPPASPVV